MPQRPQLEYSREIYFKNRYRIPSARMRGWDYAREGFYFVTICVKGRLPCLAKIFQGDVHLSPIGEIIAEEWEKTAEIRKNVELDAWIIMPDHLHGILGVVHPDTINRETSRRENDKISGLETAETPRWENDGIPGWEPVETPRRENDGIPGWEPVETPRRENDGTPGWEPVETPRRENDGIPGWEPVETPRRENDGIPGWEPVVETPRRENDGIPGWEPVETPRRGVSTPTTAANAAWKRNSLGSIIGQFKSKTTKRICTAGYFDFAWQRRFYDHIIRDHTDLDRIRRYIHENPRRWEMDRNRINKGT